MKTAVHRNGYLPRLDARRRLGQRTPAHPRVAARASTFGHAAAVCAALLVAGPTPSQPVRQRCIQWTSWLSHLTPHERASCVVRCCVPEICVTTTDAES